ncbi:MAG TPA: hypothetical protein VFB20_08370 [Burkholderiales bacterium]|nr:hypothetical protein [Burkholderiales bacterium]
MSAQSLRFVCRLSYLFATVALVAPLSVWSGPAPANAKVDPVTGLKILSEANGRAKPRRCFGPDCGIVVSISSHRGLEPAPDAAGAYFGGAIDYGFDPFGPFDPGEPMDPAYPVSPLDPDWGTPDLPPFGGEMYPPLISGGVILQKHTRLWDIEVRMPDGSSRMIEQDFPPLFRIGDQVKVEGDQIRSPDE